MNKRANIYLNIYGIIMLIASFSSIGLFLTINQTNIVISSFYKNIILLIGLLGIFFVVAIELFLFILLKNKYKTIDIIYIIVNIIIAILINIIYPFSVFYLIPLFYIIKIAIRITFVNELYIPKEFNYYCKMFGIKIKDFPKKRTITKKKINIVEKSIYESNSVEVKENKRRIQKEVTI